MKAKEREVGFFCLTPKMASFCCNDDQVRDSFFNARHGRSCSKAQGSLEKILHTISTTPPPLCEDNINPNPFKKRGFDIDLNIRLGSIVDDDAEISEVKSESLAENSFVGENPDGEEEEIQEKTATATATEDSSDVTEMAKSDDFKSGGTDGEVKTAVAAVFNDSLDLLIEAAVMISERDYNYVNEKKKEVEKSGGSMKRNNKESNLVNVNGEEEGFEEIEDISPPVVRSTRGRSQVLPQRFRDSVLEPWKKKRPQTQRSAATAAMVSKKKRRSR